MFYRVVGTIRGGYAECPICEGHDAHLVVGFTDSVVEANSPEGAINTVVGQEALSRGWTWQDETQDLEVAELPQDQMMLRIGAPTLFDLSIL